VNETKPETTPKSKRRRRTKLTPNATALATVISVLEGLKPPERQRTLDCVAEYFKEETNV
jgi:hypothetical protein